MSPPALALGAWLVLTATTLAPVLAAQDTAPDEKAGTTAPEQAKQPKQAKTEAGAGPVKIGTPATKLEKFCAQKANKSHAKCAARDEAE